MTANIEEFFKSSLQKDNADVKEELAQIYAEAKILLDNND